MATERLIIEVSETGTRVVQRNLQDIGEKAAAAAPQVDLLKRALAALGIAVTAREIFKLVDEFQSLENRLRVVTTGGTQLRVVMGELEAISGRTRTSFASNVDIFTELSHATDELGLSKRDLLTMTETLDKALQVEGDSAEAAKGGVFQLCQALALGTMNAMELKAIFRQLPVVAEMVAESLGVTRAELHALADQGKITPEVLVKALLNAREASEKFAKTTGTVGQAIGGLKDKVLLAVGGFAEGTRASDAFAASITFLGDHINGILIGSLTALTVTQIPALINGLKLLGTICTKHPVVLLAVGLAAAVAAAIEFREEILNAVVPAVAGFSGIVAGLLVGTFDEFIVLAKKMPAAIGDLAISGINGIIKGVEWLLNKAIDGINQLIHAADKAVDWVNTQTGSQLPLMLDVMQVQLAEWKNPLAGSAADVGKSTGKAFFEAFDAYSLGAMENSKKILKAIIRPATKKLSGAGIDDKGTPHEKTIAEIEASQGIASLRDTLKTEQAGAGKFGSDRKVAMEMRKLEIDLDRQKIPLDSANARAVLASARADMEEVAALQQKAQIVESVLGKDKERELHAKFCAELLADETFNQEQYNQAMREAGMGTDTLSGATEGFLASFKNIDTSVSATANAIGTNLIGSLDAASGAFADFAMSGFQDMENLRKALSTIFSDIAKMIMQMIIKMLLMKAIEASFGAVFGGGATTPTPTPHAMGGPVEAGQPYMVGERGKELFVPRSGGDIVPNGQVAAAPPVVNIVNVTDPDQVTAALGSSSGEKAIMNIIAKNRTAVKGMVS